MRKNSDIFNKNSKSLMMYVPMYNPINSFNPQVVPTEKENSKYDFISGPYKTYSK